MFSLGVLRHAVKMLAWDPWATLRLTLLPLAFGFAAAFLAATLIGGTGAEERLADASRPVDGRIVAGLLAYLLIFLAAFCWAAVAWHRYSLLSERPGALLPRFDSQLFWSYVGAAIRVCAMGLLLFLPLLVVAGILLQATGNLVLIGLMMIVPMILISARILRYSLILPAAALGQRMTLTEALKASEDNSGAFIALSLLLTVAGNLAEADISAGWTGLAIGLILTWASIALSLAVLTTLYGVCVENRDLT